MKSLVFTLSMLVFSTVLAQPDAVVGNWVTESPMHLMHSWHEPVVLVATEEQKEFRRNLMRDGYRCSVPFRYRSRCRKRVDVDVPDHLKQREIANWQVELGEPTGTPELMYKGTVAEEWRRSQLVKLSYVDNKGVEKRYQFSDAFYFWGESIQKLQFRDGNQRIVVSFFRYSSDEPWKWLKSFRSEEYHYIVHHLLLEKER